MITYIDTYNHNGLTYEDFVDYCKEENWDKDESELNIPGEDSREYCDWIGGMVDMEIEDFFSNLKYSKVGQETVTVHGKLGLWLGSPEIEPKQFDDLESAIRACWGSCDYASVTLDKGVLTVVGYHHDGRNVFTIHRHHGYFWPKYLY